MTPPQTKAGRALMKRLRLGPAWEPLFAAIEAEAVAVDRAALRVKVEGLYEQERAHMGAEPDETVCLGPVAVLALIDAAAKP